MNIKKIFTDNPITEQWQIIRHYTYHDNIKKHFAKKGFDKPTIEVMERISGALLQAEEYFRSSERSSLQISPLLLYYGMVNLLCGAEILRTGIVELVNGHGMKLVMDHAINIGDIVIKPKLKSKTGSLLIFNKMFDESDDLPQFDVVSIKYLLSCIPESFDLFTECYDDMAPSVIPIERNMMQNTWIDRILPENINRFSTFADIIASIKNYNNAYGAHGGNPDVGALLYRLPFKRDITYRSLFGRRFLRLGKMIDNALYEIAIETCMYMVMFGLSHITRYYPGEWNSFVRLDNTGERSLIEGTIRNIWRFFPNIVLNKLAQVEYNFFANADNTLADSESIRDVKRMMGDVIKEEERRSTSTLSIYNGIRQF